MSSTARAASIAGTAFLVAACLALVFVIPRSVATSSEETRVIHLVVRQMTYYVNGHADPNPTLRIRRGERVRIVVRNEDSGMKHDFGIDDWQLRTRPIDGVGEARLEFVAPSAAGFVTYSCTPHGAMMHGTIQIE